MSYQGKQILILNRRQEEKTRNYLLYIPSRDFEPYIVCTDYKVDQNGIASWDWGHYESTLFRALLSQYDYELNEDTLINDLIDQIRDFYTNFDIYHLARISENKLTKKDLFSWYYPNGNYNVFTLSEKNKINDLMEKIQIATCQKINELMQNDKNN